MNDDNLFKKIYKENTFTLLALNIGVAVQNANAGYHTVLFS